MNKDIVKTYYSKRVWLNDDDSPSTGNMVLFDGVESTEKETYVNQFIKFSDCFTCVRLHKGHYDTENDFLKKVVLIRDELNLFIKHLRKKQTNE